MEAVAIEVCTEARIYLMKLWHFLTVNGDDRESSHVIQDDLAGWESLREVLPDFRISHAVRLLLCGTGLVLLFYTN